MDPRSWSLRLVLALAVATAVWVGAAALAARLLREHGERPIASSRVIAAHTLETRTPPGSRSPL